MQKHCAVLKFFSLLVLRLRKLCYGAISANSRLKCLLDRQAAFLSCSDCKISGGPTDVSQCVSTIVRQRWPGSAYKVSRKLDCFWSIETFRAVASPFAYSLTRQIRLQGENALLTMNNCILPPSSCFRTC